MSEVQVKVKKKVRKAIKHKVSKGVKNKRPIDKDVICEENGWKFIGLNNVAMRDDAITEGKRITLGDDTAPMTNVGLEKVKKTKKRSKKPRRDNVTLAPGQYTKYNPKKSDVFESSAKVAFDECVKRDGKPVLTSKGLVGNGGPKFDTGLPDLDDERLREYKLLRSAVGFINTPLMDKEGEEAIAEKYIEDMREYNGQTPRDSHGTTTHKLASGMTVTLNKGAKPNNDYMKLPKVETFLTRVVSNLTGKKGLLVAAVSWIIGGGTVGGICWFCEISKLFCDHAV